MLKLISFLLFINLTLAQSEPLMILMGDAAATPYYAIDIAGTAEYVSKTSPVGINLDSIKFTIIGWVKTPASYSGQHHIVSTDKAATPRGWSLLVEGTNLNFIPDGSTGVPIQFNAGLSADTWYFIALVCTTTTQAATDYLAFIDGVESASGGAVGVVIQNTNPLMIGQQGYEGFERYWLGQIGEIQIVTNHNLSAAEITDAFTNGLKASYSAGAVAAWYKWSGATDAVMLNDYSASANDLTGNNVTTADQVLIGAAYK